MNRYWFEVLFENNNGTIWSLCGNVYAKTIAEANLILQAEIQKEHPNSRILGFKCDFRNKVILS